MSVSNTTGLVTRTLNIIHRLEDGLLAGLLLTMLLLASSQIFLRNLLDVGLVWADPLLRIMLLWLGLLGALAASRDNKHISIDVLTRLLPERLQLYSHLFTSLFTASVSGLIAYHSGRFVLSEFEEHTMAVAGVPAWCFEIIIPLAFALIALRYLLHFAQHVAELRCQAVSP